MVDRSDDRALDPGDPRTVTDTNGNYLFATAFVWLARMTRPAEPERFLTGPAGYAQPERATVGS